MSVTAALVPSNDLEPRAVTRIDVHAHFVPDFYREALIEAGQSQPDGIHALPQWDEASALRTMDQLGVRTAMLSISSPGVHFGDDAKALDLARRCNDEGARLRRAYPTRFGHFASLPLPNVEASNAEAIRALDDLGADGVVLETNRGGIYLGDPLLEPLYAEVDRRHAVIFIHPTSPACACCDRMSAAYPQPMIEFMFETTRSVTDLVLSGVLDRYPNLTIIVPHAGAALPALSERIELLLPMLAKAGAPRKPSIVEALGRLHFDLAGAPVPHLLDALLSVADPRQVHYGSDYPFTPAPVCDALARKLEETPALSKTLRDRIWRTNALALFPRLSADQFAL